MEYYKDQGPSMAPSKVDILICGGLQILLKPNQHSYLEYARLDSRLKIGSVPCSLCEMMRLVLLLFVKKYVLILGCLFQRYGLNRDLKYITSCTICYCLNYIINAKYWYKEHLNMRRTADLYLFIY